MPQDMTAPVNLVDTGSRVDGTGAPEKGIGLCFSGGGYRAMLFHLGALWRLNEWGYLPKLTRISSVSGGSITAGGVRLQCGGHEVRRRSRPADSGARWTDHR